MAYDKRISSAAIRKAWADESLSVEAAGKIVGLSRGQMQKRAKALSLPNRKAGRKSFLLFIREDH